jgi:uncharacterized protein YdeI (YjbR/CyaY-like superfamily)
MKSQAKPLGSRARKKAGVSKPAQSKTGGNSTQGETRLFKDQAAWSAWLDKNHARSSGIWLRIAKKNSGLQSVSYAEAIDAALCYGWIDGQKRPESEQAWLQRFCPRSAKSIWSKINREKALALIKNGRMMPAGQQAIEKARSNGRWESAYDSPSRAAVPDEFESALKTSPKAKSFFETLDRANRYAVLFRIQTAKKTETRARNIQKFIAMLERGEKIHP